MYFSVKIKPILTEPMNTTLGYFYIIKIQCEIFQGHFIDDFEIKEQKLCVSDNFDHEIKF